MFRSFITSPIFYLLFITVLFQTSDGRSRGIYTTGIADLVRQAFKRGFSRFLNYQAAYDSEVFRYTFASLTGHGALFGGESCRLSPMVCSYDEQCCSGRCLCRRWLTMGEERLFCAKDIRHSLRPLTTRAERSRLKQYATYQKYLALRLIRYQRLNDHCRITPEHSNLIESNDEENKLSISSSIEHLPIPIIKITRCSTLIASGHGIANQATSLIDMMTVPMNYQAIDEDISLSTMRIKF